jgi:hypothetical protein
MIEFNTAQKEVKIVRSFAGMEAYEEEKRLRIVFKEETIIDGVVVKSENRSYTRNYDQWRASELGIAIIALINNDLLTDNVQDWIAPAPDPEEITE